MCLTRLLLLLSLLCQGSAALASAPSPRVIRIEGTINATTLFRVKQQLNGWINEDPIPAGLIVLLNSRGGDSEAAMKIGRILRDNNAHAFVTGTCDSACVLILAGGVVRAAQPGTVGVHAGRLTLTNPDGRIRKEIDASQSLNDSFKLASFNSQLRGYFAEMGVAHGLLDVMLAHPTKQVYKLSGAQMAQYRVTGFDSQYLLKRSRFFEPPQVFQDRTLAVPRLCQAYRGQDDRFVDCYKAVLSGERSAGRS